MFARPPVRLAIFAALLAVLVLVAVPLAGAAGKPAGAPEEQLTPVIGNPVASPEPVLTSDGRRQLAYELQLINRTQSTATVKSLQAFSGKKVLETLSGTKLLEEMAPYGQPEHSLTLKPGQGAFVLMDVSLPAKSKVPSVISHRIKVTLKPAQPTVATSYELAPTPVTGPRSSAVVVAPPLRGSGWVVGNGCCADFNAHRGTVLPVNGAAHVAERFAIDFVQIDSQNKLFQGSRDQFSSYPYFGDPVYSAAAGKVVSVLDSLPETPLTGELPKGITAAQAGGNHVVVDIGHGRYAFYAHMQPGSIRVKVGQKLKVGQVIGLLGNTGNSDGPHLHFHVMDGPEPLSSNGLPYTFTNFTVTGQVQNIGPVQEGAAAKVAPVDLGPKHHEMPLDNQVLSFPGAESPAG